jgi:hypothetical protein
MTSDDKGTSASQRASNNATTTNNSQHASTTAHSPFIQTYVLCIHYIQVGTIACSPPIHLTHKRKIK